MNRKKQLSDIINDYIEKVLEEIILILKLADEKAIRMPDGNVLNLPTTSYFLGLTTLFTDEEITMSQAIIFSQDYDFLERIVFWRLAEAGIQIEFENIIKKARGASSTDDLDNLLHILISSLFHLTAEEYVSKKLICFQFGDDSYRKKRKENTVFEATKKSLDYFYENNFSRIRKSINIVHVEDEIPEGKSTSGDFRKEETSFLSEKITSLERKFDFHFSRMADSFEKRVLERPLTYGGEAFIFGIQVTSSIEISFHRYKVILRPVLPSDLEYVLKVSEYVSFEAKRTLKRSFTKIQIEYIDSDGDKTFSVVEKTMALLRLYGFDSAEYVRFECFKDDFTEKSGHEFFTDITSLKLSLSSQVTGCDIQEDLKLFFQLMFSKVDDEFVYSKEAKTFLGVAHEFYREASTRKSSFIEKLSRLVVSLDALYGEDRPNKYGIGDRVSKLLSYLNVPEKLFPTSLAQELVVCAYDLRSSYLHGAQHDKEYKKRIQKAQEKVGSVENLVGFIQFSVRCSIIAFMIFQSEGLSKKQILRMLDSQKDGHSNRDRFLTIKKVLHLSFGF